MGESTERKKTGAGDGARTRGILLGKQVLYQLSYTRMLGVASAQNGRYHSGQNTSMISD